MTWQTRERLIAGLVRADDLSGKTRWADAYVDAPIVSGVAGLDEDDTIVRDRLMVAYRIWRLTQCINIACEKRDWYAVESDAMCDPADVVSYAATSADYDDAVCRLCIVRDRLAS